MTVGDAPRTCRAKIGLLILRDCGAEAKATCLACARPICKQHRAKVPEGDMCPECATAKGVQTRTAPIRRVCQRRHYYSSYGYRPYYYGYDDHDSFHDDYDYRTFDQEQHVEHDPLEDISPGLEDTDEGRDWLGMDDFGES